MLQSPSDAVVRAFSPHEWRSYRAIRLTALADSPMAFGSTLAKESNLSDAEWESRLARGCASAMEQPLVADVDGQPVGLAWVRIESSDPALANLYQMWVAPGFRGRGIGRALLAAAIEWSRLARAAAIELGVTCDTRAMRMYSAAGFEPLAEPAPPYPGAQFLGQRMRLVLSILPECRDSTRQAANHLIVDEGPRNGV